ncbi:hypothetical protein D3C72_2460640 [compost metagenome]
MDELWNPMEKSLVLGRQQYAVVGSPDTVRDRLQQLLEETDADEWIVTSQIYDHNARLRSYEILSKVLAI